MADGIVEGARSGELTVEDAKAVKSPDFKNVFFVAVKFAGYDGEDRGVWATNSLERGGGIIMSVDGPAIEVTDWPVAQDSQAEISMSDPSVDEALSCL